MIHLLICQLFFKKRPTDLFEQQAVDEGIIQFTAVDRLLVVRQTVGCQHLGEGVTVNVGINALLERRTRAAAVGEVEQGTDAVGCPLTAEPLILIHHLADALDRIHAELRLNVNAIAMIMGAVKAKAEATAELIEKGAARAKLQMVTCQLTFFPSFL